MALPSIVIRIQADEAAMDMGVERPDRLNFSDTLEGVNQVLQTLDPNAPAVQAYDYEDEDGDLITVRSDDEQGIMLTYYLGMYGNGFREPLTIYPRKKKRHKPDIKIDTKPPVQPAVNNTNTTAPLSSRKRSGDIREILAGGSIADSDLEYREILGSGSCGTVHKAYHKTSSTPLAVKVIPLDISADAKKQIISELEILYQCHSPLIIGFYGAYFLENRISICAEWMDGGSLDKYGQIAEGVLGCIAVSVVKGLQYLWSLKIMHRDVKPSNVLVNTQGYVKLCDFGVSIQLINSIARTFIGTNAYMAPERIEGQQYSIHSEVWSLGISLFEMATGRFPYESAMAAASKPINLLKSILDKDPPRLDPALFSQPFVDFVSQCMMKKPQSRPAPQDLMRHAWIARYEDAEPSVVAEWVKQRLPLIQPH